MTRNLKETLHSRGSFDGIFWFYGGMLMQTTRSDDWDKNPFTYNEKVHDHVSQKVGFRVNKVATVQTPNPSWEGKDVNYYGQEIADLIRAKGLPRAIVITHISIAGFKEAEAQSSIDMKNKVIASIKSRAHALNIPVFMIDNSELSKNR